MKKLFFRYATGFIPFIALASCAYAQSNKSTSIFTDPISTELAYHEGKDKPNASPQGNLTINIHAKAVKNFNKTYKKTNNLNWFVIKDGFLAEFKEGDIKTRVFYSRNGHKIGTIRAYLEDKLPKDVRHLVKSNYYDYNIYYVQEVTVGDKTAYLVKMEGKTSFKTIRVVDGEMDEYEAFDKSK